jgi:hypothetical protein
MQHPTSSTSQRLRTLRRRVAAGVLATFVAAWLAVAALGKSGSATAAAPSTTSSGTTGTRSQDRSQDQSQPGPVVTGQS